MCRDFFILSTESCSRKFKYAGKFTKHFCFKTAKRLSWRGLTTSFRLSHVMKFWTNLASSPHGSPRDDGRTPFPLMISSCPSPLKASMASCSFNHLLFHTGPSAGNPETSTITASDTVICLPLTIDWSFFNFCRNSMELFRWVVEIVWSMLSTQLGLEFLWRHQKQLVSMAPCALFFLPYYLNSTNC